MHDAFQSSTRNDHRPTTSAASGGSCDVGMALWLLSGGSLPDRVAWSVRHGFRGLALLQTVMQADAHQRRDAAAIMRQAGLRLTYHGNVHENLAGPDRLDIDFVHRMYDDVLWWQKNAGGMMSCGSDPIHLGVGIDRRFIPDLNQQLMHIAHQKLTPHGIAFGLENSFGPPGCYQSVADLRQFRALCERLNMGLLLDTGHTNVHLHSEHASPISIEQYIRQLPMPIFEVHVTDNDGRRDEHRHVGHGCLDLAGLVRGLKTVNFSGLLTVEVCVDILHGRYAADIHDSRQTDPLLITRDRLREAWGTIRTS